MFEREEGGESSRSYVEAEALDVGVGGDPLLLRRGLNLFDLHLLHLSPPRASSSPSSGDSRTNARVAASRSGFRSRV